jgi:hypothetical protein
MSPPISSTVKERVIQLFLEGKGRNEIAQTLNLSHVRISQGSVTNILRAYKSNTDKASTKATSPCLPQSQVPTEGLEEKDLVNPVCLRDSEEKETNEESSEDQESFVDSWSMIFEQVTEIKKRRRELEQKEKELEQERMQDERARNDLEIREIGLLEVEPLILIARQLQDLGTDINQFLPWSETIHEKAQAENIPTLTKAAYSLAQDLRMYRQLGGLKKNVQLTTHQLDMLNISLQKQQQAVMTLVNLQSLGISESQIVELIDLVNQSGGIGVRQRNMNGSISRSGGQANEFKFKLDDRLIV